MSPKSKTQTRRETRKNSHASSHGSGNGAINAEKSNKQQQALAQLKKQFDSQAVMIRMQSQAIDALRPKTGDSSMDNKKSVIDEKYVKVPSAIDTALGALVDSVDVAWSSKTGPKGKTADDDGKITALLLKVQESVKTIQNESKKMVLSAVPSSNLKLKSQVDFLVRIGQPHNVNHANVMVQKDGSIKLKGLSIKLAVTGSFASAANTAFTTPVAITPGNSAEFGNCAGLFDEYICDAIDFHFRTWTDGATANIAVANGIVVYDPIDNTAYASIANAIVASQKFGPFAFTGPTSSAQAAVSRTLAPMACTPTGFFHFHAKMPKMPQESPTVSVEIITGHWDSTIDTGGIYGYIKPYFDTGGAGNTTNATWWMLESCRFRSRT